VQYNLGTLEQADNEAHNTMILNNFFCLCYFRTPRHTLEQTLENGPAQTLDTVKNLCYTITCCSEVIYRFTLLDFKHPITAGFYVTTSKSRGTLEQATTKQINRS